MSNLLVSGLLVLAHPKPPQRLQKHRKPSSERQTLIAPRTRRKRDGGKYAEICGGLSHRRG